MLNLAHHDYRTRLSSNNKVAERPRAGASEEMNKFTCCGTTSVGIRIGLSIYTIYVEFAVVIAPRAQSHGRRQKSLR